MNKKAIASKSLLDSFSGRAEGAMLSATRIGTMMRCARQFEFRYVRGIKSPPSVALIEGIAAHTALAINNEAKMEKQQDLPTERVIEAFNDDFTDKAAELNATAWKESHVDEDTVRTREGRLLATYMEDFAPPIFPEGVEEEFKVDVDGTPFVGHIDLVEPDLVTDYKTAGSNKWNQAAVENHFQLQVYAWHKRYTGVSVISLIKTKLPRVTRTHADHDLATLDRNVVDTIKSYDALIQAGLFPPCDPGSWVCSSKFCGYWKRCRGKKVSK